jgi:flagellar assembly protein FliH
MADAQGQGTELFRRGRVFMGERIAELDEVENTRSRAWDAKDENAYLARVREKAAEKAREIVAQAEAEASSIRAAATEQGYAEGIKQAEKELEEARASMRDAVSTVLAAIQEEAPRLSAAWRDDLASLVRLAAEKAFAVTLSSERGEILKALYLQAVRSLEDSRFITVRVNPEDAACVEDIISLGRDGHPGLESWRVTSDPSISPGGLIVESSSSLADNSVESRVAAVNAVLAGLTLPG